MTFRAITHGAVDFLRTQLSMGLLVPFPVGPAAVKDVIARTLFLLPALGRAIEALL